MERNFKFLIEKDSQNIRLDKFLVQKNVPVSRSSLKSLIKENMVKVNGKKSKPSYKLKQKDCVELSLPIKKEIKIKSENISLNIVYEDENLLIVNKPAGMIVHPATNVYSGTLVNALLYYTKALSTINGPMRRGIVHRLDKDTTGLLVVAKDNSTHIDLAKQLAERKMKRGYFALVQGRMKKDKGKIETIIGRHPRQRKKMSIHTNKGKKAVTFYKTLEKFPDYSLLKLDLGTGRTHQIRVHLAHLGYPVAGDKTYGGKKGRKETLIDRPALHAYRIRFKHPSTGHFLEFSIPLPDDFQESLRMLHSSRFA